MSYAVSFLVGCSLLFSASCNGIFLKRPSPYIDKKILDNQTLRPEWKEIRLEETLKPIGDHQEIGLYLADPYEFEPERPPGVRLEEGLVVLPEVQLIAPDGQFVEMKYSGARGKKSISYRLKDETIKREYVGIRLRADTEIPLDAVYWSGFIIKNMP